MAPRLQAAIYGQSRNRDRRQRRISLVAIACLGLLSIAFAIGYDGRVNLRLMRTPALSAPDSSLPTSVRTARSSLTGQFAFAMPVFEKSETICLPSSHVIWLRIQLEAINTGSTLWERRVRTDGNQLSPCQEIHWVIPMPQVITPGKYLIRRTIRVSGPGEINYERTLADIQLDVVSLRP